MQRACAAALLHQGLSYISNPGDSNDDVSSLHIAGSLGATWKIENGKLIMESRGVIPVADRIHCGESGLAIRMFAPIIALCDRQIEISGSGSLQNRPMDLFEEIFPQLGIEIETNSGKLPLLIKGPLQPKNITIDGSLSSQFLTGLLMAFSAAGAADVSIKVINLKSKPYIDLTLKVMEEFGMKLPLNRNYEEFYFTPGSNITTSTRNQAINYVVEGDWSGASFLLVAAAIAGEAEVSGLDPFSPQADKKVLEALMSSGAVISVEQEKIMIRSTRLKAFHFDATDCPDLFPPLVALAAYCDGTSVIQGVGRLAHKESDRALVLKEEFGKMGVNIELQDELMIIRGTGKVKGAIVHSHNDHRIAMACAVAAIGAGTETTVREAEAINKSYPSFFDDLKNLQAAVSLSE